MTTRALLVPAAGGLALCAAAALLGAARLAHTGAWTLLATAAILAGAAIGLLARQLWAYVFAVLTWVAAGLGLFALGVVGGWKAVTDPPGSDWAVVGSVVLGVAAVVALALGVVTAIIATSLAFAWRQVAASRSVVAWAASVLGAIAGLGLVAWLVGDQYLRRQLPKQNECLAGRGLRCYSLANDTDRFSTDERRAFALRGCQAGDASVCRQLAGLLDASHAAGSAEAQALDALCQAGNPEICRRLGVHLLKLGDREGGGQRLSQTCSLDVRHCDAAAKAAEQGGQADLARQLLEQGCEREDAGACRGLLRAPGSSLPPEQRAALQLTTCLIGDVNDCLPLMRRDLRGVCARICEGTSEARMHTCGYCSREAVQAGEPELAEAWLAGTCQRGYSWGCRDLAELRERPRRSPG